MFVITLDDILSLILFGAFVVLVVLHMIFWLGASIGEWFQKKVHKGNRKDQE